MKYLTTLATFLILVSCGGETKSDQDGATVECRKLIRADLKPAEVEFKTTIESGKAPTFRTEGSLEVTQDGETSTRAYDCTVKAVGSGWEPVEVFVGEGL